MRLVERFQCKKTLSLSHICNLAKNLYNAANFQYRQLYYHLEEYLTYYDLQEIFKSTPVYKTLPAQTSQQILRLVIKNWKGYWRKLKKFKTNPTKSLGLPKPPKYKKKDGESVVIFTNQNSRIKNGLLCFPKSTGLDPIKTHLTTFQQVRILPKGFYYIIEIVYKKEVKNRKLNPSRAIGIDLGVNNLVAIGTNCGEQPILISGRAIKAINQQYNKLRAKFRSKLLSTDPESKKLNFITRNRYNQIYDIFHKTSRKVVNFCISHNIGTIVIGNNKNWKQRVSLGKRSNQNFVSLPFVKLIKQIKYKAELCGIAVHLTEESYTSICSALDLEPIYHHSEYLGKRLSRGLFQTHTGLIINADVNGALNILRKVVPITSWGEGIAAVVLQPKMIQI